MQNDLMGLESERATPAPNPPPISSATPAPIAPLIYKVPLFSQGGWKLCWAYCAVMIYCYKNNVTDMTQEEADLMAFSFAYEYQLDKLQIDAMTIGTCWWNQGGWPADIGTECLARDIGSIYSIRELLESGPVYGYYNGEIETNGARIPDAHLIVVTGVDVNNDIIYTNNPWGYSGEQTFEEFMHGFYMSPYENMPLCNIFQTKRQGGTNMKKYALWALLLVAIILLFIIIVGVDEINQSRNVLNLTEREEGDCKMKDSFQIFFDGQQIISDAILEYSTEYSTVEIPLLAMLRALGFELEWKNEFMVEIQQKEKRYSLDVTQKTLSEEFDDFNYLLMPPGDSYQPIFRTDKKEIYVDNRSIFYFLRKAGYILRVDLNKHVISIFSANPY